MDLIADTIFIFGGFYHNNFLETLYALNIGTLEVMSLETKGKYVPDRRAYHGSTVIGQLLFIYGGLNERNIFNDLFILDTIKLMWTKISLSNSLFIIIKISNHLPWKDVHSLIMTISSC